MACDNDILKEVDKTNYAVVLIESDVLKNTRINNALKSKVFKRSVLNISNYDGLSLNNQSIDFGLVVVNGEQLDESLEEVYLNAKRSFKQFKILIYNRKSLPFGLKHLISIDSNKIVHHLIEQLNVLKRESIENSGDLLMKFVVGGVIAISIITALLADLHPKYAAYFMITMVALGFSKRIFKMIFFLLGMKKAQAYCECL